MGDVIGKFMDPLRRIFALPKNAEGKEDEFFEAYFRVLDRYDDEVLTAAALRIIETHKARVFPLPAECVDACAVAKDAREAPDLSKPAAQDRFPEWSDEARATANRLFNCPLGRQALAEDWALTFHDWLREHGRWPNRFEIEKIRDKGKENSRKFWELVSEDNGVDKSRTQFDASQFIQMRRQKIDKLRQMVS